MQIENCNNSGEGVNGNARVVKFYNYSIIAIHLATNMISANEKTKIQIRIGILNYNRRIFKNNFALLPFLAFRSDSSFVRAYEKKLKKVVENFRSFSFTLKNLRRFCTLCQSSQNKRRRGKKRAVTRASSSVFHIMLVSFTSNFSFPVVIASSTLIRPTPS